MWACSATRSRAGFGSRLHKRATVELRPSAAIRTRAENVPLPAVSIVQSSLRANDVTVVLSQICAPAS